MNKKVDKTLTTLLLSTTHSSNSYIQSPTYQMKWTVKTFESIYITPQKVYDSLQEPISANLGFKRYIFSKCSDRQSENEIWTWNFELPNHMWTSLETLQHYLYRSNTQQSKSKKKKSFSLTTYYPRLYRKISLQRKLRSSYFSKSESKCLSRIGH